MLPRAILAALLAGAACADPAILNPESPYNRLGVWTPPVNATILQTESTKLVESKQLVVDDRATWQSIWADTWGGAQLAPALPSVDFVLASVLVVAMGRRGGTGYSVTIDSVVQYVEGAALYATEEQPGEHCPPTGGLSSAVHMVGMPGHPPVIDWHISINTQVCAP